MMVVSGLLTVIGALGVSRVHRQTRRRSHAMIIGLVIYGSGIATAGLLRADPAEGFPIGTPQVLSVEATPCSQGGSTCISVPRQRQVSDFSRR